MQRKQIEQMFNISKSIKYLFLLQLDKIFNFKVVLGKLLIALFLQ